MLVNYIAFVHNLYFHGSSRMRLVECDIQIKISVFITICQTGYQFEVLYTALRTGIEIHLHIMISDGLVQGTGITVGGHLNKCIISGTCELRIDECENIYQRRVDDETGIKIIDI